MRGLRRRHGRALGVRPANPAEISFDPSCFVRDGTEVYWTVSRSALHSGPARFETEASAAEYARRVDRPYTRHESPRMRRVSWRKP